MTGRPNLLLTFDFPPMGGGIARMMGEIALRSPPGEVIVSTGQFPGGGESDVLLPNVVDRLAIPAGRLKTVQGLLRWSVRAGSLTSRHGVGFVWCGNLRPAAYAARWVKARCGVPYGVVVYGGDLLELRRRYRASAFKRRSARWLLGGADLIVAISRWTRDLAAEVLQDLGLEQCSGKLRVIPLGTDPQVFRPGLDPAPLMTRHQLPGGRWLVTVARLVPHKGIDITIRALALLAARFPDLHYAVVGQGSYQLALKELAQREGVADRVHFLTDVSDRLLPLAYSLAEVYVGVSRQTEREVEGFGIALLEAQASGRPVVGGTSGGIPDAIKAGETGWLADSEDPADVARAVASLLDDPVRAAAFGWAGRTAVESFYNWPRVVAQLRALTAEATSVRR